MDDLKKRNHMPVRDPSERCRDFGEVALGYDEETAVAEAERCLNCKTRPCTKGCPVGVDIPSFITLVQKRRFEEAYAVISRASSLPAVCGRVCPQERQCERACVRGIKGEAVGIGGLERFVADRHAERGERDKRPPVEEGAQTVAVVGSGPSGLACAGDLVRMGYSVTVFEALHALGGVLAYGIPEFRLPKSIVARETERLGDLGVRFVTNTVVGRTFSLRELRGSFDAVFLGVGAGLPKFMGIEGENAKSVFSANEYLTRVNLMKAYEEGSETPVYRAKRVVVVGGGNVAMDAARTARRLGAETTIVYRRSEEELPARREEIGHAKDEGVAFRLLANPVKILTDGDDVVGIRCVEMELKEPDASGRRRPVEKAGSEFDLQADCVIMAIGTSPNPIVKRLSEELGTTSRGEIVADGEGRTSLDGVFAGGDAVTGSATVILGMGAGKRAARAIDEYLKAKKK